MTTKYQRQWTEFEAIKSIYEKEFEEIKFPWKVDHPPWFRINLKSGILLELRMTSAYPDGIPDIILKPSNSSSEITTEKLEELGKKLKKEAGNLLGNEMCFDLIEIAREFGENLQKRGKTSFHSEMLLRQEERDKRVQNEEAKDEEVRRRKKKTEMEELEKRIREEVKDKLNLKITEDETRLDFKDTFNYKVFEFESDTIVADNIEISTLNCNLIEDWTFGKCFISQEFCVKTVSLEHPFLQTFGGRRQLEMLLKNLKSHPIEKCENVSRCFGGNLVKESAEMVLVCERSLTGSVSLGNVLEQAGCFAIPKVISYLKQICLGLSHLHASGITHRNLDLNCIIVDGKGAVLKITDYLIRKCLNDLIKDHGINFNNHLPDQIGKKWQAPEIVARPNFHGKKVDIWSVGCLTLQMIFGKDVLASFEDGIEEFKNTSEWQNLHLNIKEFLNSCLATDSALRMTADELLNCKLFHEPIANDKIVNVKLIEKLPTNQPAFSKTIRRESSVKPTSSTSRYSTDFEELEFLGRGGFGSVVKVRNKIDDRFYAIKKIYLDPRDIEYNKKILREVTTLSRLHHERIIRYYQAWIEECNENEHIDSDIEEEESDLSYDHSAGSSVKVDKTPLDLSIGPKSYKPFSGLNESFEFSDFDTKYEDDNGDEDDFIEFERDGTISNTTSTSNQNINTSNQNSSTGNKNNSINTIRGKKTQVLYIQMEYCPNQTLRDLIDERNEDAVGHFLDSSEIWRLFRQIVEGLVHIHAQGMMHRDLKPSNIFLDSNGDVKIGDFGLAVTRIEGIVSGSGRSESPMPMQKSEKSFTGESHTQNIGTPFYVSPEQITVVTTSSSSANNSRYNQKVDMYALGIILVELWTPFKTGMERINCLQRCRLPEVHLPQFGEENVSKIARRLLCHDAKKRFTSLELLRSDLLPPMLEEELMEDAMRSVARPGAPHFQRLISTIFDRLKEVEIGQIRPKDFAFDVHSGNATDLLFHEEIEAIRKELEKVFLRYGAIEVNPPLLYLQLEPSDSYSVLDDSGQCLELPNNLTRPFARWLAQSSLNCRFKRFSIDRVYRKISQVSGGQPFQPYEAAFDLIHTDNETDLIPVCEVVKVMFDCILALGNKPDQLVFKFNHLQLRSKLVQHCKTNNYKDAPDNYAGLTITKLLAGSFDDDKIVKSLTPVKSDESIESQIQRISSLFKDLNKLLILELYKLLLKLSIPAKVKIVFDPLMKGPRPDLYENDFCFVVLKEGKRYAGGHEIISCGGRYNQLVEEYKFPTARLEGKGPFAIGMSLFLEKFTSPKSKLSTLPSSQQIILNLAAREASNEEIWLIGELWRFGRGSNLIINAVNAESEANPHIHGPGNQIQLQVKSTARIVRIKCKGTVEEVTLEEVPMKLNELLDDPENDHLPNVEHVPTPLQESGIESNASDIHYIISSTSKPERNPILREKAHKALKLINPGKSEIVIHELPRDILKRIIYDQSPVNPSSAKYSDDFRDQISKLGQLMQGKLAGKMIIFLNHKDNQIDILFNK